VANAAGIEPDAVSDQEEHGVRGKSAAYIVAALFTAWMLAYLDRQIVSLLVPALKHSLHLSDSQVSLLQGIAFSLVFGLAGIPLGRFADRTVRRTLVAAGMAFWSLATIACGLADSFAHLFVARMCVGLGEACMAPAIVSLVADYFAPSHRGRALGFVQIGAPIGNSAALILGGALLTYLTLVEASGALPFGLEPWQLVFITVGAPGILAAAVVMFLQEPPRRESG